MKFEAKEILYRGGIARFSIPSHWKEEYEPAGGATFYEDVPESGTLRLNVLSFQKASGDSPIGESGYKPFRDDLYLKSESERFTEDGVECILLSWLVGYETDGNGFRIACFRHTIEASQFRSERTQREIEIIKWILKTATFGREPGVAGDFNHDGGTGP